MKKWNLLLLLCLLLCLPSAQAAPQTITAVGEYTMGDGETMAAAKERARAAAMRTAAEQAGVYLESTTEVQNLAVTNDEITVIAGSILQVQNTQYSKKFIDDNSILFTATVTAVVDPIDAAALKSRLQEKQQAEDYGRLQEAYKKSQEEARALTQQLEQLKGELAAAQTQPEKERIRTDIAHNEQNFSASQWIERGNTLLYGRRDYFGAVQAYTQAIAYDAGAAEAWRQRAMARRAKGDTAEALNDFAEAIRLSPYDTAAYLQRASLYALLRRCDAAIDDYTLVLGIEPQAAAYTGRGSVYLSRHAWEAARSDYAAALSLDADDGAAYFGLARASEQLGDTAAAIDAYQQFLSRADSKSHSYTIPFAKKHLENLQKGAS